MKKLWIFLILASVTSLSLAQDAQQNLTASADAQNKKLLQAEKAAAKQFFKDLMAIDAKSTNPEASWILVGRAVTERETILSNIEALIRLVENQFRNSEVHIRKMDPSVVAEINDLIGKIRLAVEILPESNFKDVKFALGLALEEMMGDRSVSRSDYSQSRILIVNLNRLHKVYSTHPILVEAQMPNNYMTQLRFLARLKLFGAIHKTFARYDLSNVDVERFMSDLGEGKGEFAKLYTDLNTYLGYQLPADHRNIVPEQLVRYAIYASLSEIAERGSLNLPVFDRNGSVSRGYERSTIAQAGEEPMRLRILKVIEAVRRVN